MPKTFFKLYGLDHSGSHYLAWLLNNNYKNVVMLHSHTGWNHGEIVTELTWNSSEWNHDKYEHNDKKEHGKALKRERLNTGESVLIYKNEITELYQTKKLILLCLIRNPYSWLNSFNIKHDKSYKTLEESLIRCRRVNLNYFNNTWPNKFIIKYETLRDDTKNSIEKIGKAVGLGEISKFKDTNSDVAKGGEFQRIDVTREKCIENQSKHFNISKEKASELIDKYITEELLSKYNRLP